MIMVVDILSSEILIKPKDFLFYEYRMKNSCSVPQVSQLHYKFSLFKEGNCTYGYLYRAMKRIVVGGHSTFKSMEELAEAVERDCWYYHNYGDAMRIAGLVKQVEGGGDVLRAEENDKAWIYFWYLPESKMKKLTTEAWSNFFYLVDENKENFSSSLTEDEWCDLGFR